MSSNKDVNNYCRLCASELAQVHLKSNEQIRSEQLDLIIIKHLHIEFDSNNTLPKKACDQCCNIISTFHNYYNQVQNAQQLLQNIFQSAVTVKVEIKADVDEPPPLANEDKDEYPDFSYFDTEKEDVKCEIAPEDNDYTLSDSFFDNDKEDVKSESDTSDAIVKEKRNKSSSVAKNKDPNIEWRCYKCEKIYYSRTKLDSHFHNIHNTDPEYMCLECKALFTNLKQFEEHIVEHPQVKQKLRTCEICNKIFTRVYNLKLHRKVHLGIKPFECDLCGKKFTVKHSLDVHRYRVCSKESDDKNINKMVNMTSSKNENDDDKAENESADTRNSEEKEEANWVCCKCKLDFKLAEDLKKHHKLVHDEIDTRNTKRKKSSGRTYECTICEKEFSLSANLKNHMLTHTGERKFRCNICPKKFSRNSYLISHRLTHIRPKPNVFRCEYCDKIFKQASHLSRHVNKSHSTKEYECNICCTKFTQEKELELHKEWHQKNPEQKQEVICDKCGKVIKKCNLSTHMFQHSVNIFRCDMCPKTYKGYSGLRQHKKSVHSTERPYQCEICNKRFCAVERLTSHKQIHSNDYKFECQYCPKKFVLKNKLRIHMRQHTGERPYSCLECNHLFSDSGNFIKHLKGRHRLKNFSIQNNHQYPFLNDSSMKRYVFRLPSSHHRYEHSYRLKLPEKAKSG